MRARGIIIADTKFEFGTHPDIDGGQTPILIDEVLTPDSSRFWPADQIPDRPRPAELRQAVRARLAGLARLRLGQRRRRPPPRSPPTLSSARDSGTSTAYERITGEPFPGWLERVAA